MFGNGRRLLQPPPVPPPPVHHDGMAQILREQRESWSAFTDPTYWSMQAPDNRLERSLEQIANRPSTLQHPLCSENSDSEATAAAPQSCQTCMEIGSSQTTESTNTGTQFSLSQSDVPFSQSSIRDFPCSQASEAVAGTPLKWDLRDGCSSPWSSCRTPPFLLQTTYGAGVAASRSRTPRPTPRSSDQTGSVQISPSLDNMADDSQDSLAAATGLLSLRKPGSSGGLAASSGYEASSASSSRRSRFRRRPKPSPARNTPPLAQAGTPGVSWPHSPGTPRPPPSLVTLRTPELRPTERNPPPTPNWRQQQRSVEEDINMALQWRSLPFLLRTLLMGHACKEDHVLHEAISHGHCEALEFLLQSGVADLEAECNGIRPLMAVAKRPWDGNTACRLAELLLRHGADVDARGRGQETALLEAVARGCVPLVELLLRYGANPNLVDSRGRSALHEAFGLRARWESAMFETFSIRDVDLLLAHGADPRMKDAQGLRPREYLPGEGSLQKKCLNQEKWLDRGWLVLCRALWCRSEPSARQDTGALLATTFGLPEILFRTVVLFL